ncbi:MAG: cardiolipin synthase [Candidatus Azobacteroides sp.]|nr:cardiolipin synthase [Candidatus Azobacteroides sp.]
MNTQNIIIIFQIIYITTALFIAFIVISENRNPIKTMSWVLLLLFVPIIGIIVYYFFGQDARRLRRISKKRYRLLQKQSFEPLIIHNQENIRLGYTPLVKLLNNNNDAALIQGSEIEYFSYGKEKFEALIRDLEHAQHHIHFQYYIFENDKIGKKIKHTLMKKASEGVEVRVLYDDAANWKIKNSFYDEMQTAGVEVTGYLRVHFPFFTSRVNYRNHRKIVVIDGRTGYIGGMNIADRYLRKTWKDMHLRITGKGVLALQSAFLIDWVSSGKHIPNEKIYFPENPVLTNNILQIATGGPINPWRTLLQATVHILANAKKYVYIQTPYFLPTESLLQILQSTALSGVDVRLMVPEKSDTRFVNTAAKSYFSNIMTAGVKVYLYKPAFLHAKMMVADDFITVVGSANMDFRSFEHNFEVNAYLYDKSIAGKMKQIFLEDQKNCKQVLLKEWEKRSRVEKFKESVMRMFSPLL